MKSDTLILFRVAFMLLFLATLFGGAFLLANFERFFGRDPSLPSENSSARSYGKVQALAIWVHAVLLTGAFAFFLS